MIFSYLLESPGVSCRAICAVRIRLLPGVCIYNFRVDKDTFNFLNFDTASPFERSNIRQKYMTRAFN